MTISASFSGLTSPTGLTAPVITGLTVATSGGNTPSTAGNVFFGWLFYYTLAS